MSTAENRKAPRVNVPHVLVKISSRDRFRSSYLKDLSEGGLFVKTEKALAMGSELVIDLLPPGWTDTLRLKCVVVRSQNTPGNAGMAVRFENNEEASMEVLRALVNDYQSGASPPEIRPEDSQDQLQKVLGQIAVLKNTLEKRDAELHSERSKREETSKRVAVLTAELEISKSAAAGAAPDDGSSRLKELETELATSQHEEMELRTRLAEVEGEVEAFKHELETLEQDDSTSRRLASGLAKEKADLTSENAKLSAQLAEVKQRLKDTSRQVEEHASHRESQGQNDRLLTEKLQVVASEADELRLRVGALETRTQELASLEAAASQLAERLEQELSQARIELTAMTKRASAAETAAKDALSKAERSKLKERELRELMQMVTSKTPSAAAVADDVVEFDERPSSPSQASTSPSVSVSTVESFIEMEPPSSMPSVAISFESGDSMVPEEPAMPSGIELLVDVDVEEAALPPPPPMPSPPPPPMPSPPPPQALEAPVVDRSTFEKRLRGNEPLTKTGRFDSHAPRDDREKSVLGLLQAGGRFSELMVLGRGVVAPAELIDALYTLLAANVVRFEEPKPK